MANGGKSVAARKLKADSKQLREAKDFVLDAMTRAQNGDPTALPVVKRFLADHADRIDEVGDIARHAQNSWLKLASGENLLFREGLERKCAALKQQIAGESASALEELLVDRIVSCWLQVHYAEATAAQNAGQLSRDWADHYQRRQTHAQRRYLSAIKALAQVRKLLGPTIQVNIAKNQVNLASVATG
jgi:hypothetical protein